MRRLCALALAFAGFAVAGCGDDEKNGADPTTTSSASTTPRPGSRPAPNGALVRILPSDYGPILFDSRGQVVYGFTHDRPSLSRCSGDCAREWPPFITRGRPRAGRNVDQQLLGTTRRRDGRLQVTYAGKPLYFYANEGPRQVRCQNVTSFGGVWLVVRGSGRYLR